MPFPRFCRVPAGTPEGGAPALYKLAYRHVLVLLCIHAVLADRVSPDVSNLMSRVSLFPPHWASPNCLALNHVTQPKLMPFEPLP